MVLSHWDVLWIVTFSGARFCVVWDVAAQFTVTLALHSLHQPHTTSHTSLPDVLHVLYMFCTCSYMFCTCSVHVLVVSCVPDIQRHNVTTNITTTTTSSSSSHRSTTGLAPNVFNCAAPDTGVCVSVSVDLIAFTLGVADCISLTQHPLTRPCIFTHSTTRSIPHSLTHSLTHHSSLAHSSLITHSPPSSLPHTLAPSLTHSLSLSLPPSLRLSVSPSLSTSLTHSLTHSLAHSLTPGNMEILERYGTPAQKKRW